MLSLSLLFHLFTSLEACNGTRAVSTSDSPPAQEVEFDTNYRSTLDIVWSCLLTIFACTWISVHPNVLGYRSTWQQTFRARMELMLWGILAPELIVVFAFRQWSGARKIKKEMNAMAKREGTALWTDVHSHFLQMGGFIIREQDGCIHYFDIGNDLGDEIWTTPLAFKRHVSTHGILSSIVTSTLPERDERSPDPYHVRPQASSVGGSGGTRKAPYSQTPCMGHHQESLEYHRALLHAHVMQDEIWDRSKGDALTKSFVILQTLWFAIQSAARWIRHLESTHLEVTTLAYVALNGVMYFFWWDKPLDVQSPIVIDLGHQELLQPGSHLSFECQYGQPKDGKNTRRSLDPIDLPRHPPQLYLPNHEEKDEGPIEAPHELSKTPDHPSQHIFNSISHRVRNWLANLFWGFISRLKSIVEYNIGREESQAFHAEPQRFPMFYALRLAPLTGSYSMVTANHSLTQLMGLILASAFGAIHCIAWNFKSGSSPVPQLLWRISSLCIAASPGILILVFVLIFFVQWPWRRPLIRLTMSFGTFIVKLKVVGQVAIMVYIPARTVLLFLAFYDLKWLSPSTHRTVEWSSFIPHLG